MGCNKHRDNDKKRFGGAGCYVYVAGELVLLGHRVNAVRRCVRVSRVVYCVHTALCG